MDRIQSRTALPVELPKVKHGEAPVQLNEAQFALLKMEVMQEVVRGYKTGTDQSPFNRASRNIDRVINEKKLLFKLSDAEITDLYQYVNKIVLEPLAKAEGRSGRTDWTVPEDKEAA